MTLVVPFDGSELAEAALGRAVAFGNAFDEAVLAVSVVPNGNAEYARERGWIGPAEPFDRASVVGALHEQVVDCCPSAEFRSEFVGQYAQTGTIANRLRKTARDEEATMVFIGSDNAGRIVTSISSVGGNVAADGAYNVVIVRNRRPSRIPTLREANPRNAPRRGTDHVE